MKFSKLTSGSVAAALVVALAIPVIGVSTASAASKTNYSKITTASQGGGMSALAAACKTNTQPPLFLLL